MQRQSMITMSDLVVRYGTTTAVHQLSFTVQSGEIFGLLGPNGAGKTSTLACIEGIRTPTTGNVQVAGYDMCLAPAAAKQLLGVQLQKTALFAELTAGELVELYAALYNLFPPRAAIIALLEQFGLGQKANARPGQLSGGQQQRLALALAVVNNPQVVLLDEPSTGLDPQARRGVWALIRRMQSEGRTIVLTTHSMEEAQTLCDRVGILAEGRLVALDTPAALIATYAPALPDAESARRQPNLEDVFLALTGRGLSEQTNNDDLIWLADGQLTEERKAA
jgi:ABC-2 type transport system ATP-binding protein